jgi:hypothetical protein
MASYNKIMDTFDTAVTKAALEVAHIVVKKQRDYGPKNIMNSVVGPELSIAVRLNDKLARLANLVQSGKTPENETLKDTADDIIGYGLVLKMVLEGTFTLPLENTNETTRTSEQGLRSGRSETT